MGKQQGRISAGLIIALGILLCMIGGYLWIAHLVSLQYFGPALHRAARAGNLKAVQWQLRFGADINDQALRSKIGRKTPLHLAIENHHADVASYLLAHGANPNLADIEGQTPLHFAVKYRADYGLIRQLLENNANPNCPDSTRLTPLHLAAMSGNTEYIVMLIDHGAQVNAKDLNDQTPLAQARESGDKKMITLLKKYGAR